MFCKFEFTQAKFTKHDRFIKANCLAPKRDKSKRKYHRDPKMFSAEIDGDEDDNILFTATGRRVE